MTVTTKLPATLTFNKINGEFLSASTVPANGFNTENSPYIYVEDRMCVDTETVLGGLLVDPEKGYSKNYVIVPIASIRPKVFESHLNAFTIMEISNKYPLTEQINLIARAVQKLAMSASVEVEELNTFVDFVNGVKAKNSLVKDEYKNNLELDYITEEEQDHVNRRADEGVPPEEYLEESNPALKLT